MIKYNKRGFTLVELIISLAIIGIVTTAIYAFFLSNYKTLDTTEIGVDLQSNGNAVMNKIMDCAISAKEVPYKDIDITGEMNSIVFKSLFKSDNADDVEEYYCIFVFNKESEELFFNKIKESSIDKDKLQVKLKEEVKKTQKNGQVIAKYISSIIITLINNDNDDTTDAIDIEITIEKDGEDKEIKNYVEFRN